MPEPHFLYEALDTRGLLNGTEPVARAVASASRTALIETAVEIAQVTAVSELPPERSLFAPSTTLSLGGGRAVCINIDCRMQKLQELGRFAGLYADRVYVPNFFTDHLPASHAAPGNSDDEARQAFYDDLALIGTIRPLVEAGLVVPVTAGDEYCPHCVAKRALGKGGDRRVDREFRRLRQTYLDQTEVMGKDSEC
jgi:hypothetical protein